ncbi:MAG: ligase-associated DNA damage response endonuclease PdeM [Chitinophagales bacterium]|nr:ligase-associated DNA damage response endonuclease PdeM [Chitinophagales bacterium]
MVKVDVAGEELFLLPQRAIWWPDKQTLIVADTHFGKVQHFRKSGLAVPHSVFQKDLETLNELFRIYNPSRCVVVGDMFHSSINSEVHVFEVWRAQYPDAAFTLVRGNHDILNERQYREMDIELAGELHIPPFSFTHKPKAEATGNGLLNFCGHIHPGVLLRGPGKLRLKVPCFYFDDRQALLPAFAHFTGLEIIQPRAGAKIFAVTEEEVIQLHG